MTDPTTSTSGSALSDDGRGISASEPTYRPLSPGLPTGAAVAADDTDTSGGDLSADGEGEGEGESDGAAEGEAEGESAELPYDFEPVPAGGTILGIKLKDGTTFRARGAIPGEDKQPPSLQLPVNTLYIHHFAGDDPLTDGLFRLFLAPQVNSELAKSNMCVIVDVPMSEVAYAFYGLDAELFLRHLNQLNPTFVQRLKDQQDSARQASGAAGGSPR